MAYKLRQTDADVLICDGAAVCGDVTLGKGVSIWYNAVLRGDDGAIIVGEGTNIQDAAVLHEETTVGAGALVTGKMDAPAGSMILGSPAKVVRPLTEAEIAGNRQSAQGYLEAAERCRQG